MQVDDGVMYTHFRYVWRRVMTVSNYHYQYSGDLSHCKGMPESEAFTLDY